LAAVESSSADLVLLDSGQGTGQTFDWSLARAVSRPFLLAGGLTPDNIPQAIQAVHPYGLDLSSGVETERKKDKAKILAAVAAAHTQEKGELQ
jgi:phosphoribosylanthranilate isomerase